mmetsp:Transcript_11377/g.16273  ORF Transcript_11377/g.16273 Transcript_11377/m.16273 type:complete len:211 (+) Transcript_11377:75-707(+)
MIRMKSLCFVSMTTRPQLRLRTGYHSTLRSHILRIGVWLLFPSTSTPTPKAETNQTLTTITTRAWLSRRSTWCLGRAPRRRLVTTNGDAMPRRHRGHASRRKFGSKAAVRVSMSSNKPRFACRRRTRASPPSTAPSSRSYPFSGISFGRQCSSLQRPFACQHTTTHTLSRTAICWTLRTAVLSCCPAATNANTWPRRSYCWLCLQWAAKM